MTSVETRLDGGSIAGPPAVPLQAVRRNDFVSETAVITRLLRWAVDIQATLVT